MRVVTGHAGEALLEAADDAGMIVVGSKGRSAVADLVLGSTAGYVTRRTKVPVVVVPHAVGGSAARAA